MEAQSISRSGDIGHLAMALCEAQGSFTAASKDCVANLGHGRSYHYASLASLMQAVRPALHANKLAFIQRFVDSPEPGCKMLESLLMHTSGQYIVSVYRIDTPAGAKTQEVGSAITYARRYSMSALLGVVADEDDDAALANNPSKTESAEPRQADGAQWYSAMVNRLNKATSAAGMDSIGQEIQKANVEQNVKNRALIHMNKTRLKFSAKDAA